MKRVLLATVFSVAISSSAFAGAGTVQTNPGTNNGFQIQNTGTIKNTGTITNHVNTGTQNSNNKTVTTKVNSDNKTTVTKNDNRRSQQNQANGGEASAYAGSGSVTIQGNKRVFNAPDLGGLPSGPCTGVSGGFTVGTPVFGGGIQGGGLDDQCTLRENIRIVNALDPELAREMVHDLTGVQAARDRIAARNGQPVAATPTVTRVATDWSGSHTH